MSNKVHNFRTNSRLEQARESNLYEPNTKSSNNSNVVTCSAIANVISPACTGYVTSVFGVNVAVQ